MKARKTPPPGVKVMNDSIKIPKITKLKPGTFNSETDVFQPAHIIEHIQKAHIEAIKMNIKANAVLISDKLYFSKLQLAHGDVPMICGLKCVYANDLPNDTLFAVVEALNAPLTKDEHIKELEKENAKLRAKIRMISDFIADNT